MVYYEKTLLNVILDGKCKTCERKVRLALFQWKEKLDLVCEVRIPPGVWAEHTLFYIFSQHIMGGECPQRKEVSHDWDSEK